MCSGDPPRCLVNDNPQAITIRYELASGNILFSEFGHQNLLCPCSLVVVDDVDRAIRTLYPIRVGYALPLIDQKSARPAIAVIHR